MDYWIVAWQIKTYEDLIIKRLDILGNPYFNIKIISHSYKEKNIND
jgi:hypothetical protein